MQLYMQGNHRNDISFVSREDSVDRAAVYFSTSPHVGPVTSSWQAVVTVDSGIGKPQHRCFESDLLLYAFWC